MEVFSKAYLKEVIENQGKLFEYAQDYCPGMDIEDFIDHYMNSRTRSLIDEGQAYVSTMDAESLFDYFLKNDKYKLKQGKEAVLFKDQITAEKILQTDDVAKIKALGRTVQNFDDEVWAKEREGIVYNGVLEKFRQNPELAEKLKKTGEEIIAECAVKDRIWGIGLSIKDENRLSIDKWRGQNLLGRILMRVREDIRHQNKVNQMFPSGEGEKIDHGSF